VGESAHVVYWFLAPIIITLINYSTINAQIVMYIYINKWDTYRSENVSPFNKNRYPQRLFKAYEFFSKSLRRWQVKS
jgi:hypothetical protein